MTAGLALGSSAVATQPIVSSIGRNGLGIDSMSLAGAAFTSAAYPGAKIVYYIPIDLDATATIQSVLWMNGATVGTNNVQVGVYTSVNGLPTTRLAANGTTTLSAGANIVQSVSVGPIIVPPGTYFLAVTMDGTTATLFRMGASILLAEVKALGMCQETTGSFGLPATATPIADAFFYIPLIGFSTVTTI